MYEQHRRGLVRGVRLLRLVEYGGDLHPVERFVADDFGVGEVCGVDLRVERVCELRHLLRGEVIDVKIRRASVAVEIKGHQTLAWRDVHARDVAVRKYGQSDWLSGLRVKDL